MKGADDAGPGRGRLVVFEGIDGSGKSTAMAHVAAALTADGVPVHATREETDGPTGGWVRASIADGMDPLATTFLFLADRAQHMAEIRGHLTAGRHVLCDRYIHSTLAYQGVTLQDRLPDPTTWLRQLHAPWAVWPDHVLWFDAAPATCLERIAGRSAPAPYERVAFLERVREGYRSLSAADPAVETIDGNGDADDVAAAALERVRAWLTSPSASS